MADQPAHNCRLYTGNGHVTFLCCQNTEHPYERYWVAPPQEGPLTVPGFFFHTARQPYVMVADHLTHGHDAATIAPVLEAAENLITTNAKAPDAEPWTKPGEDVRAAIQHLAEQLDNVTLEVAQH